MIPYAILFFLSSLLIPSSQVIPSDHRPNITLPKYVHVPNDIQMKMFMDKLNFSLHHLESPKVLASLAMDAVTLKAWPKSDWAENPAQGLFEFVLRLMRHHWVFPKYPGITADGVVYCEQCIPYLINAQVTNNQATDCPKCADCDKCPDCKLTCPSLSCPACDCPVTLCPRVENSPSSCPPLPVCPNFTCSEPVCPEITDSSSPLNVSLSALSVADFLNIPTLSIPIICSISLNAILSILVLSVCLKPKPRLRPAQSSVTTSSSAQTTATSVLITEKEEAVPESERKISSSTSFHYVSNPYSSSVSGVSPSDRSLPSFIPTPPPPPPESPTAAEAVPLRASVVGPFSSSKRSSAAPNIPFPQPPSQGEILFAELSADRKYRKAKLNYQTIKSKPKTSDY